MSSYNIISLRGFVLHLMYNNHIFHNNILMTNNCYEQLKWSQFIQRYLDIQTRILTRMKIVLAFNTLKSKQVSHCSFYNSYIINLLILLPHKLKTYSYATHITFVNKLGERFHQDICNIIDRNYFIYLSLDQLFLINERW